MDAGCVRAESMPSSCCTADAAGPPARRVAPSAGRSRGSPSSRSVHFRLEIGSGRSPGTCDVSEDRSPGATTPQKSASGSSRSVDGDSRPHPVGIDRLRTGRARRPAVHAAWIGVIASICSARPSCATSRSYWLCRLSQNCADVPKYRPSRRAVSAETPLLP